MGRALGRHLTCGWSAPCNFGLLPVGFDINWGRLYFTACGRDRTKSGVGRPDMAQQKNPNPWRYAHMGLEFSGAVLVLTLVGWYVDRQYGTRPWGAVIGATLGFSGGMYLFIKEALKAVRSGNSDKPT